MRRPDYEMPAPGRITAVRTADLFAGMGGFTEAAGLAGYNTDWAANHWRAAVDVHAVNHPNLAMHMLGNAVCLPQARDYIEAIVRTA